MNSNEQTQAISKLLLSAFERLKAHNRLLSLRALALKMDLSASYVSKLFNGKKEVSLSLVPLLQKHLSLDLIEVNELQRLILLREEAQKATIKTGVTSSKSEGLSLKEYRTYGKSDLFLLEKWYYLPLLNLLSLKSAPGDSRGLAHRLGLQVAELEGALKQLQARGYISSVENKIIRTDVRARFPSDRSHEAFRNYHKMMMKKAGEVMSQQTSKEDFESRLVNGISFTGSAENIQKAQLILNEAMYQVAELMAQGEGDDVFHLGLQFFKVTVSKD